MKKEVKNWLEQAEHDIEVAEYNLEGNMLDAAAFYSQQAAEKALKSLIMCGDYSCIFHHSLSGCR
jgi:HEPN domain-containing protein